MKKLTIGYGALMPKLEEQVNEQGYTLGHEADKLEKIRFSINMCGFHVATESQIKSMLGKLHKKVEKALVILED